MTANQPAPSRWLPIEERLPSPALLLLLKHSRSRPEIMAAMRAQGLRLTPERLVSHIESGHVSCVGKGKFLMFCLPGREDEARALRSKALASGRAVRDRNAEHAHDDDQAQTAEQAAPTPQATKPMTSQPPPKKREAIGDLHATVAAEREASDTREAPKTNPEPDALRETLTRLGVQIAQGVREARAVEGKRAELLMRARALEEVLGVMQSKMLRLVLARDRVQAILDQSAPPLMCMDDFERVHLAPKLAPQIGGATQAADAPTPRLPVKSVAPTNSPAPIIVAPSADKPESKTPDPTQRQEPSAPRREQPAQRSNADCVELSREMATPDGKKCIVTFTQSREGCTVLRPGVFVAWLDGHGHPNGEKIQGRLGEMWDRFCADEPEALARTHAPTRSPVR